MAENAYQQAQTCVIKVLQGAVLLNAHHFVHNPCYAFSFDVPNHPQRFMWAIELTTTNFSVWAFFVRNHIG
jgi:hypothetical protein